MRRTCAQVLTTPTRNNEVAMGAARAADRPMQGVARIGLLASLLLGQASLCEAALRQRVHRDRAVSLQAADMPMDGEWQPCAEEGQAVAQAGRTRFGFGALWVESSLPAGASCSTSSFGSDPAPFVRKVCECAAVVPGSADDRLREELGLIWRRCGGEGESCDCKSGVVRFGNGQRWVVMDGPGHEETPCGAGSFKGEDPDAGVPKECWCDQGQSRATVPTNNRVAVVMLSRRPPDLRLWLEYHMGHMGVEHLFLQVEDSPGFNTTFGSLKPSMQQRVTVWRAAAQVSGDTRPQDDYETLQKRQISVMARAKQVSTEMGISWLIHIDDDELLYSPTHRHAGDLLAQMPNSFDQAYIPNAEAVYPSADVTNCFAQTTEINVNAFTFASYANGKAAVRVSDSAAVPAGPHMWKDARGTELASIHLDHLPFGAPLIVVHFESCPFVRWESKFWELGNTAPRKIDAIPFRFYRDSIKRMQECNPGSVQGAAAPTDVQADCSKGALQSFWAQWKTEANPSIRRQDLVPLNIPWANIQASM
mmetsp:Transcript_12350/g.43505  ORF Transcript_12350/g.43505 Transcript_12350/m.43505 type:complete len:535 (-) Transcript_12350:110-1714(-)